MLTELRDILHEILPIEEGLVSGDISFQYDKLMSAMKIGHPVEILDDIISQLFWQVEGGIIPDVELVEEVAEQLDDFIIDFDVAELEDPLAKLEKWIEKNK